MIRQQDMTEARVVSVWVGDFDDYMAFDAYMLDSFERDHGFLLNDRAMPEASEPDGRVVEIRELLTGFSWSEDWLDEAVRLCCERGCPAAKMAAVFLHLRYRPEICQNPGAPLRFITNVTWIPKATAA